MLLPVHIRNLRYSPVALWYCPGTLVLPGAKRYGSCGRTCLTAQPHQMGMYTR